MKVHVRSLIAKNGHDILYEILNLQLKRKTYNPDVVIFAIDFENLEGIQQDFSEETCSQVGLAVLDVRDIQNVPPHEAIVTHNFVTGTPDYISRVSKRHLFGETTAIHHADMLHHIQSCFPPNRCLMLVGFSVTNDLQVLLALDFPSNKLSMIENPPLVIIDAYKVAATVFGSWKGSLATLLRKLGCPFEKLHMAGNDANFTMRALLLLALKGCTENRQGQHDPWFDFLSHVATSGIPLTIRKLEKRSIRRLKSPAESRSAARKDQIRAARKERREENEAFDEIVHLEMLYQDPYDKEAHDGSEDVAPTPGAGLDAWLSLLRTNAVAIFN